MAKLVPNRYLLAQCRSKEGRSAITDASAREIDPILVPASIMRTVPSSRRAGPFHACLRPATGVAMGYAVWSTANRAVCETSSTATRA